MKHGSVKFASAGRAGRAAGYGGGTEWPARSEVVRVALAESLLRQQPERLMKERAAAARAEVRQLNVAFLPTENGALDAVAARRAGKASREQWWV